MVKWIGCITFAYMENIKEQIIIHYKSYFGLQDVDDKELGHGDKIMIEWAEELVKTVDINRVKKGTIQAKDYIQELCDVNPKKWKGMQNLTPQEWLAIMESYAMEQVKNCYIPNVAEQSEQLPNSHCTINRDTCGKGNGCKYPHCLFR